MREFVYFNGKTVPAEKACVCVFDRGLAYGDGLFETMKAVDGRPLFLKEHMRRLIRGARQLGFAVSSLRPLVEDIDGGAIENLLRKNRLSPGEASVKVLVTRGVDRASHLPTKGIRPTAVIMTRCVDTGAVARLRASGVSAITVADLAPAMPGVKSLNYIASVLAKMRADRAGAFEAIFTRDGLVVEGASSNIFIVEGARLVTPPLAALSGGGPLAGVTRGEVARLARRLSLPVSDEPVAVSRLKAADEAFLTSSIMGIVPLVKVDRAKVGPGRPGPATKSLQELMRASREER